MSWLLIELPADRDICGRLVLSSDDGKTLCGPFSVAGRAGDAVAGANKNPSRDRLLRYGDTPIGAYVVRHLLKSGKGTAFNAAEFGAGGVVVIEGVAGEAAYAEANGRFHLLISGGPPSAGGQLRATAGGLRLSDADIGALFAALKRDPCSRCEIVEESHLAVGDRVSSGAPLGLQDPFPLLLKEASRPARAQLREGLLSGAMVFGMTVSFVAMQGGEGRASTPGLSAHRPTAHDQGKTALPVALPAPRYVRLAYETTGGGGPAPAKTPIEQLNNATNGVQTLGQTFDGGKSHDDGTVDGGGVVIGLPSPAQAEPPPTPEQQQQLNNDTQYQHYQEQSSTARNAAAEAAAEQQVIQTQITNATEPAVKAQLQVDLAKARQDESAANSAAAAAQINAEARKKVVIQGAPVLKK